MFEGKRSRTKHANPSGSAPGLAHVYQRRSQRVRRNIFDADHSDSHGGRFRWLISTCLAAMVGAVAILVVIYGSADPKDSAGGFLPALEKMRKNVANPTKAPEPRRVEGLKWATPRTDKLAIATGTASTRFIIHESHKGRRDGREYIRNKPYVRIAAKLSAVPATYADVIPPFNPFKLYASAKPITNADEDSETAAGGSEVSVKVVELLGGILPGEDGQELDNQEVIDLVARTGQAAEDGEQQGEQQRADAANATARSVEEQASPYSTAIPKSVKEAEFQADLEGGEVRVIKASRGDTLIKLLNRAGADMWQAREMTLAAKGVFPDQTLAAGHEVHITLLPSLTQQGRMEPAKFSVFADGHDHKVTVSRSPAGEFVASATPFDDVQIAVESDQPQSSSLYASLYHAGLVQSIQPDTISSILRIHAYDTDFRRRLRAGDSVEFFFDLKDDGNVEGPPGELLFTSVVSGGEVSRFWRFRSSDGSIDFYDENGNNSRKFLMRRPVRGEDVRLTSGYGVRFHPLLNERKMHTGVDWSAPIGTPIMAAGTGVIEEAGRKGHYGQYIRIRHANGYQTAYAHMSRFAAGVDVGAKVRQGQIIGYVGSTGLSSGPHLHYEVLVSNRFVDPMSIQVPRERKLEGKDFADFQRERTRIDELMRRAPVMTKTAQAR